MQEIIQQNQKELEKIFRKEEVVLAYLFGSHARGTAGPGSDVDIAVLFAKERADCFEKRISLASTLEQQIGARNIEVVCLKEAPPLLKHRAVLSGRLLYAATPSAKREMELGALQDYEDFRYHLAVTNKAMRKHISQKTFGQAPLPHRNPRRF